MAESTLWGSTRTAGIEVVCGSMFSGKTEELLRRLKRAQYGRQRVQLYKPQIDNRYSVDHVQSHDANRMPSIVVKKTQDIFQTLMDNTRVVGIDEVQFFDLEIIETCNKLANRGLRVIVAGLDMDYRGIPFGPMPHLMAIAESVTKLNAICVSCGGVASRTQRLSKDEAIISVGAQDIYEARCRFCHEVKNQQPQLESPHV